MKILALAVNKSAQDGEWRNAAIMFVSILRKNEWCPDIEKLGSYKHADIYSQHLSKTRMPFGKYKGVIIADLPTDYIQWMQKNLQLKGCLKSAIDQEIKKRKQ